MILQYWCSKWLRNPIYFAAKAIKSTKYMSIDQTSDRPSGLGGPGNVEEGCYNTFGSQRGQFWIPMSQLVVSCKKETWGESPGSQPKEPEHQYSIKDYKMEGLFL